MTSEKKIETNRQNALKSTGPKSFIGKANASRNSLKHGLLSQHLIIREEKPKELELFRQGLYSALCPQSTLEEILVEKIINSAWRLRRITKVENEVLGSKDSFCDRGMRYSFYGSDGDCLQNLSRYQSALERTFYKALHELQRLQGMRMGQLVPAPLAIEVNIEAAREIGFVS